MADDFAALAAMWRERTAGCSSVAAVVADDAYREIIAMGWDVVPEILRELRDGGGYWYPALAVITKASPATAEERRTMGGMRAAWLRWGRERGMV